MATSTYPYSIAIACGGTGGHLFPGLAVANKLAERHCDVTLIISRKEVDQQAIADAGSFQVLALPAVGLTRGRIVTFLRAFHESYLIAKRHFQLRAPEAVLGMGGFTSAAPIIAGKKFEACTFLHESNSIPGRANRWLSRIVDHVFAGFRSAAARLPRCPVTISGTPVRPQFYPREASDCRAALGLDPFRPVVLVVGGSQGASGINQLVAGTLPLVSRLNREWQWIHFTGVADVEKMKASYANFGIKAVVHAFFNKMELALGAASAVISRAGASSLAELSAMRVPSLLIPYPAATDNHQFHNARAYADTGAARMLLEKEAVPERLANLLGELVEEPISRNQMQSALAQWDQPLAAEQIARHILRSVAEAERRSSIRPISPEPIPGIIFEPTTAAFGSSVTPHNRARGRQEQPASI
jgi:UDP-N-acetylglucosamine--N-acetylmuramyl-(pentapeptide) pyrophosphoryl-undecaprenol N-acetylglucosamine transferase